MQPSTLPRTAGLIGFSILANLIFAYWYFFSSTSDSQPTVIPPPDFPLFPSHAYTKVVHPEDTDIWPYRVYKSSPFTPPYFTVKRNGGAIAEGYLFMTPKSRGPKGAQQSLPVIMTNDNDLVYCLDGIYNYNNFRIQSYHGKPYLTAWEGFSVTGHGYGQWFLMDDGYIKNTIPFGGSFNIDLTDKTPPGFMDFHEQQVTSEGTVLVAAYNITPFDLSKKGGSGAQWVVDSLLYEIDIETKEVVFRWNALDHIDPFASRMALPSERGDGSEERPYDFFHLNSMQLLTPDTILISSRHFWACYLISRKTGEVLWMLDGTGENGVGNFGPLPLEGQFRYQHHARGFNVTDKGFQLSLYDNHHREGETNTMDSRAILLDVSMPPDSKIPPVVLRSMNPLERVISYSQGAYDAELSNGNQLVVNGQIPVIREYGPSNNSADIRWEGRFGNDNLVQSYRAFKSTWKATPKEWGPSLVYEKVGSDLTAYVSWNGATEVKYWRLYGVGTGAELKPLGQAAASGFETVINIPSHLNETQCILAAAFQDGREVRLSNRACHGT
ncbi:ASST-domain-containing protein [Ilyonectria robusta]|uniref:ASST-domain-containing protein n=1 Tax=Ilyonectria robusta TaxID=1079257 RepID=UPI001E8EB2D1|nr:ASST-domain-containing protein [Ilyonectria robusta]KAH8729916.1 ASST-domain-containing protein [Ilyonectria robusta]